MQVASLELSEFLHKIAGKMSVSKSVLWSDLKLHLLVARAEMTTSLKLIGYHSGGGGIV